MILVWDCSLTSLDKASLGEAGGEVKTNCRDQSSREKPLHESDECEERNKRQSGNALCGNTVGKSSAPGKCLEIGAAAKKTHMTRGVKIGPN